MKSPGNWTVAVRGQNGEIHMKREKLGRSPRFFKLPLLRGVMALFQALVIGLKALEFAASNAYEEEGEGNPGKLSIAITMAVAALLGAGIFILLPLYAAKLLGLVFSRISANSLLFNLTDGLVRVGIFFIYIVAIGLWKEMARIFMYHGAEHKAIHAYEAGQELTIENARPYSTLHPRCGTSFLMIVMVVSILIFSFIPQQWPFIYKFLARVVLIPLVAGSSFELLKFSSRWKGNLLVNLLIQPGLMLQRLTTKEPDDSQIEVALAALLEVVALEGQNAR